MDGKVDAELVKVIESAISESRSCVEALDRVIEWKKENRGLKVFHVSTPIDIMLGTRKVEDHNEESEEMAHDVLMMNLIHAKGHYKDVTNEML